MLSQDLISFLSELKQNNHKEWFDLNRNRYQKLRKDFIDFIDKLIPQIAEYDSNINGLEGKKCVFRINRDIRFSPDKTPYKTNVGAYISQGGKKGPFAGYYLHIEPGGSFLAGGIYQPESKVLKEIRSEIYYDVEKFKALINDKNFKKYFKEIWSEKLKAAPRGFSKDWPEIELLKFKNYTVIHEIDDNKITDKKFLDYSMNVFKALYPFNSYFNDVIKHV